MNPNFPDGLLDSIFSALSAVTIFLRRIYVFLRRIYRADKVGPRSLRSRARTYKLLIERTTIFRHHHVSIDTDFSFITAIYARVG
jgi:hypothetical protein